MEKNGLHEWIFDFIIWTQIIYVNFNGFRSIKPTLKFKLFEIVVEFEFDYWKGSKKSEN